MFYLAFYLIVSYFFIGVFLEIVVFRFFARGKKGSYEINGRRWPGASYSTLALIGLLLPFVPYAVVSAQTRWYGAALLPVVKQAIRERDINDADQPIQILRVLKINPGHAEVYIVQPCTSLLSGRPTEESVGFAIRFVNKRQGWQYQDYDCVWSLCGSADGNTFPPYPEAKEL
jgi:hypothetical protein